MFWWAPAGIDRGRVFNAVSVAYKTSRGERDVLYPEGVNKEKGGLYDYAFQCDEETNTPAVIDRNEIREI